MVRVHMFGVFLTIGNVTGMYVIRRSRFQSPIPTNHVNALRMQACEAPSAVEALMPATREGSTMGRRLLMELPADLQPEDAHDSGPPSDLLL